MVDLSTVIEIIIGIFVIGGGVIGFFVMQKGQNMKIEQLQKEVDDLKRKQSLSTSHQIETEKFIAEINIKLEHIMKAIDEIKNGN
jgi:hypothetical protein